MKRIVALVLVLPCILMLTACTVPATQLLQLGLDTFVAAMKINNPSWSGAKLEQDVAAGIAAWGVGTNWQVKVISELTLAQSDVADIPDCNAACQGYSVVFLGAIETAIAIAQANSPATLYHANVTLKAQARPTKLYVKGSKADYSAYKKDWNAVAPVKLP